MAHLQKSMKMRLFFLVVMVGESKLFLIQLALPKYLDLPDSWLMLEMLSMATQPRFSLCIADWPES